MGTELSSAFPADTLHVCTDCEEAIVYTEETFLFRIVQPQVLAGAVLFHDIIDEHDPEGGFLFQPFYYCFSCWENHYDELRREAADQPPVPDAYAELECVCCGSGVRSWEYAGVFTLGEFHVSPRRPNNEIGPRFNPIGRHEVLCLYCVSVFNNNYITMWDDLSQDGECCDCIFARCWRFPDTDCGCGCHEPDPHFDYEFEAAIAGVLDDNDDANN